MDLAKKVVEVEIIPEVVNSEYLVKRGARKTEMTFPGNFWICDFDELGLSIVWEEKKIGD